MMFLLILPENEIRFHGIFLFFLINIFLSVAAWAQDEYFIIEKVITGNQIKYSSGDRITFRIKGDDHFRTDHIIALNDTAIEFHYYQLGYDEIDAVKLKGKRFTGFDFRQVGAYMQIAGVGYIAIDIFNKTLVQGSSFEFEKAVWITGAAIFAGGTFLKLFAPKKIRIGRKYRIRYLNFKDY